MHKGTHQDKSYLKDCAIISSFFKVFCKELALHLYPWACSQRLLSCCVSPCALFPEPVVGKAGAERLEDARSPRNCRHVYSLLAGTT